MPTATQPSAQQPIGTQPSTDLRQSLDLDVEGMTCASCAARIEKKLGKLTDVTASVNYATGKAHVLAPTGTTVDDLIATVRAAGYDAAVSQPDSPEPPDPAIGWRRRLIVAASLAIPVIALAMIPPLQFPGWQWVSALLATPVVTWAAWPFHRSALVNLRHGATTMDTLISLGTTASYLWSIYALFFTDAGRIGFTHGYEWMLMRGMGGASIYFEASAAIITFLLLGRYLEARSRREAGAAIRTLLDSGAKHATVIRNGKEQAIPAADLVVGDVFVVRPGEKIPTDATVLDGTSAVDMSLVTGESVPVDVTPGDGVIGGTVNTTGRLRAEATRVGKDTQLAQMARLVEEAQTGKGTAQRLVDKISGIFVPIVIGLAVVTLIAWLLAGESLNFALTAAVAVLIIACPCALGLATPTALLVGSGRGAQLGIVIAGQEALEATRKVDTIVLDKTGTLTTGTMTVSSLVPVDGSEAELRAAAIAVESGSEHPVGKAIAALGDGAPVTDFAALPGLGVRGVVAGHDILAGSPRLFTDKGMELPPAAVDAVEEAAREGRTTVIVSADDRILGVVALSDEPKDDAAQAVQEFLKLGLHPVLLSGDSTAAATRVAREVGIEDVRADVSPADKASVIASLQSQGKMVAMVGDGVNDAAALAQADLGIAMGSGSDAAIAASDITLMKSDPMGAADAIRLSRATMRTITANLFWAFAYNVAAIPLAALGFLNPMIASAAMAFSSVFVVGNSLRLRGFKRITR